MLTLYSGSYDKMTVFPEMEPDERAILTLTCGKKEERVPATNRQRVEFVLQKNTLYSLSLGIARAGLIYLYDEADVLEKGVYFWERDGAKRKGGGHHFRPYQGYMGAPCGLCHYQGLYHLFYEWNPFGEEGDTLYWGHAVSEDMLSWRHLPLLFEPQAELRLIRHRTGGARAGSAEVCPGLVRLYFTRSIAARSTGAVQREYPVWAGSRDMVHFSEEMPLPIELPESHAGPAFGGPHLFGKDGTRYMVLGSTWQSTAALLLYREKGNGWEFVRPLVKEKGATVWENPDFFRLGRSYVAIGTFGEEGNPYWYLGGFADGTFRKRSRARLDFGGDFFAPQTFLQDGRRLMIGCIDRKEYGNCMSLPKEVFSRGGRLFLRPAKEVYSLRAQPLYRGHGENKTIETESDAFMAELQFSGETDLSLRLGEAENAVCLRYRGGRCFWETKDGESEAAEIEKLHRMELFADAFAAEVFLNDGEAAGTVAFFGSAGRIQADFSAPDKVKAYSVWRLNAPAAREPEMEIPEDETFEF